MKEGKGIEEPEKDRSETSAAEPAEDQAEKASRELGALGNDLQAPGEKEKSDFTKQKEYWYDRINLSVKQLDIIIWVGIGILIVVFILIGLEAAGIFSIGPGH